MPSPASLLLAWAVAASIAAVAVAAAPTTMTQREMDEHVSHHELGHPPRDLFAETASERALWNASGDAARGDFARRFSSRRGPFHTKRCRGGVHRRQLELKGVDGGD